MGGGWGIGVNRRFQVSSTHTHTHTVVAPYQKEHTWPITLTEHLKQGNINTRGYEQHLPSCNLKHHRQAKHFWRLLCLHLDNRHNEHYLHRERICHHKSAFRSQWSRGGWVAWPPSPNWSTLDYASSSSTVHTALLAISCTCLNPYAQLECATSCWECLRNLPPQ